MKITKQNELSGIKALEKLEHNLHKRLPEDYRKFLLSVNGGQIAYGRVAYVKPQLGETYITMTQLYGLQSSGKSLYTQSIENAIKQSQKILSEDFMPIADEIGGHIQIVMSLSDKNFGSIHIWLDNNATSEKSLVKVADDFNNFLEIIEFE